MRLMLQLERHGMKPKQAVDLVTADLETMDGWNIPGGLAAVVSHLPI